MKIQTQKSDMILNYDDISIRKKGLHKKRVTWFSVDKHVCIQREACKFLIDKKEIKIIPFLNTRLTMEQVLVTLIICDKLKMDLLKVENYFDNFNPSENRIQKKKICGRNVVFDGDVTVGGRMLKLVTGYYKKQILVIENLFFGFDPVEPQLDSIISAFKKCNEVRILNSINAPQELFDRIYSDKLDNIVFVGKDELLKNIPDDYFIFYHNAGYFKKKITY